MLVIVVPGAVRADTAGRRATLKINHDGWVERLRVRPVWGDFSLVVVWPARPLRSDGKGGCPLKPWVDLTHVESVNIQFPKKRPYCRKTH